MRAAERALEEAVPGKPSSIAEVLASAREQIAMIAGVPVENVALEL